MSEHSEKSLTKHNPDRHSNAASVSFADVSHFGRQEKYYFQDLSNFSFEWILIDFRISEMSQPTICSDMIFPISRYV